MSPRQASEGHRPERDLKPPGTARVPATSWDRKLGCRSLSLCWEKGRGDEGKELKLSDRQQKVGTGQVSPTIDHLGRRRWYLTPGGSQGGVSRQPFHSLCTHKIHARVRPCERQKYPKTRAGGWQEESCRTADKRLFLAHYFGRGLL